MLSTQVKRMAASKRPQLNIRLSPEMEALMNGLHEHYAALSGVPVSTTYVIHAALIALAEKVGATAKPAAQPEARRKGGKK